MKLHYQALVALRAALKASRQLTFAEQAQANEVLDECRRCALRHYRVGAACQTPEDGDSRIERLLKHHGLYEVCTYAADGFPGEDPSTVGADMQDLIMGLAREAANGYAVSTHHEAHRLTAPSSMQAALTPPKRLALPDNARIGEAEDTARDAVAMAENANRRCEALESRVAALENALSLQGPSTDAGESGEHAGKPAKEGAT